MYSEIPVCTHVCATIILSHRHERLNQKPSWGGRVCISHPWFARDTEWFTLTCFLLMASDRRWLWSDAVCRLLLICVLLETRVTWAILVPFGVNIRVRLMFWPLTSDLHKSYFRQHPTNFQTVTHEYCLRQERGDHSQPHRGVVPAMANRFVHVSSVNSLSLLNEYTQNHLANLGFS